MTIENIDNLPVQPAEPVDTGGESQADAMVASVPELLPEYYWHRPEATLELVLGIAAQNGFSTVLITPSPAGFHVVLAATAGAPDPRAHGDAATLLEAASRALEGVLAAGR